MLLLRSTKHGDAAITLTAIYLSSDPMNVHENMDRHDD